MARIVRFYETGGPEILRFEEAIQHPRKGEVLIQVEAIGLKSGSDLGPPPTPSNT
jgi:NADPH2:quinone reductase